MLGSPLFASRPMHVTALEAVRLVLCVPGIAQAVISGLSDEALPAESCSAFRTTTLEVLQVEDHENNEGGDTERQRRGEHLQSP